MLFSSAELSSLAAWATSKLEPGKSSSKEITDSSLGILIYI